MAGEDITTTITHISAYKFIALNQLESLRAQLLELCAQHDLCGTILLSEEGINLNLAGVPVMVESFISAMHAQPQFADMWFKLTHTGERPYKRLLVKIKNEIITLRHPGINPAQETVPNISPEQFRQWLSDQHDVLVLDTRNAFEVGFGTFESAIHLDIESFSQFPAKAELVLADRDKSKPVVMFCTGGVRCEKAGPVLRQQGFENVYQLEGGILNYFQQCGGDFYQGDCFVFDERIALNPRLENASVTAENS